MYAGRKSRRVVNAAGRGAKQGSRRFNLPTSGDVSAFIDCSFFHAREAMKGREKMQSAKFAFSFIIVSAIMVLSSDGSFAQSSRRIGQLALNPFTPEYQACFDQCVGSRWSEWCQQSSGTPPNLNCLVINQPLYQQTRAGCRSYCEAQ